jgi:acyl-coenzyme A thioesterase PaaI-like protein
VVEGEVVVVEGEVVVVEGEVVVVEGEVVVVEDSLLFFFCQTNTFPTLLQTNGFFNVPLSAPGR